jgi:hypothetical protein
LNKILIKTVAIQNILIKIAFIIEKTKKTKEVHQDLRDLIYLLKICQIQKFYKKKSIIQNHLILIKNFYKTV